MPASSKRAKRVEKRNQYRKQTGQIKRAHKGAKRQAKQQQQAPAPQSDNVIQGKFQQQRNVPPLQAKTPRQKEYLESLQNNTITIATGHAGCVDSETEFLSQDGWKKISEYSDGDKVMQVSQMGLEATLVDPTEYIKKPCDWFYAIESERGCVNQWLSPEHNVAYTVKNKTRLNKKNIEEVLEINENNACGFSGKVPCVYDYADGFGIGLSEDYIRLAVALKADGYLQTESTGYYVVRLKKQRKIDRLKSILDTLDYEYKIFYQEHTGYQVFSLHAPWCSKRLSDWMMCSKEDAQIIMDEYPFWDGDVNPVGNRMSRFSTCIKEDADAMQYFANICGFRATIGIMDRVGKEHYVNGKAYTRKSVEYMVSFTNVTHVNFLPYNNTRGAGEKQRVEKKMSIDGYKYCFTVPSGYLVLRRNDKVFVTGNSGKTYCASYYAAQLLNWHYVDKIVITRPYVHLGKDAGATPGTDFEKMEPFVKPMLEVIKSVLGTGNYNYCLNKGMIEVAPLEKIQGRSFDEPVAIIADEMQNASRPQAVSLVTRISEQAEFLAVCGDPRQSVQKGYNTLDWLSDFFERNEIRSNQVVHFTEEDCVRSGIVKDILVALEKEGGYYSDL